jgi:hypothetical protein
MTSKCQAQTYLSAREFSEVDGFKGPHQPTKGPWYCEYPGSTIHFQHSAAVQGPPLAEAPADDDRPDLWLLWSDDGRRELRWRPGCQTRFPNEEDEEGDLCILPGGHRGRCDASVNNEYQPSKEMIERIQQVEARIRVIQTCRALRCPTVVIREGDDEAADYEQWNALDHSVSCPDDAPCHQAEKLSKDDDQAAFDAFIAPYGA